MSGNTVNRVIRSSLLALGLSLSASCFAWHGGWHGGGWHGGGWHHGWHGGYYHGGGWGWGGAGVVIGAPLGGYGYYSDECKTVRVCNPYGHCWLQQSCY